MASNHQKKTSRKPRATLNLKQFLKCVGLVVLAFYLCVTLLDQQRQINENARQVSEVWMLTEYANLQNEILQETLARVDTDENIIRTARERGFAMPGDRVFIDSARIR